ncbi:unnamed protein product [Cylicocyclus nassatus]|uniref:Uncharacterized protein n=1 Tax=Cylicocyclus nassatus TaxID=53992 RepID=A0AA36GFX3_CYLNA|nr:unnamed protein product [Cylicocyclus nassatus]
MMKPREHSCNILSCLGTLLDAGSRFTAFHASWDSCFRYPINEYANLCVNHPIYGASAGNGASAGRKPPFQPFRCRPCCSSKSSITPGSSIRQCEMSANWNWMYCASKVHHKNGLIG